VGGKQLRLFVAVYPPLSAARAMLASLAALEVQPDPRHRPTPPEQVHLTLQFVGSIDERNLPGVAESVHRAASGLEAFELAPQRLVTFPERGMPRLIAMETTAPAVLLELQRRLATRLARQPRPKAGDRFRPHLTLARFSGSARPQRLEQHVSLEAFAVSEVVLVRSILLPEGARHVAMERALLG
jgi:RNA 2',3'-cyclic 3'-phosphodiesterase